MAALVTFFALFGDSDIALSVIAVAAATVYVCALCFALCAFSSASYHLVDVLEYKHAHAYENSHAHGFNHVIVSLITYIIPADISCRV